MDHQSPAPQTTKSLQEEVGSVPGKSASEIPCVVCPICSKEMGIITNTHLRLHGLTIATFQELYPSSLRESADHMNARMLATWKSRKQNPDQVTEDIEKGKALANYRASLTEAENEAIHQRSVETLMKNVSPAERTAHAIAGHAAMTAKHPNWKEFLESGRAKSLAFWKSEEGKQRATEMMARMWGNPQKRLEVIEKIRQRALQGRIHLRPKKNRPTTGEKKLIGLSEKFNLPLVYTGDGLLRVTIPSGGRRHWRNPDFVVPDTKKAVLVDSFWSAEHPAENLDYQNAGWEILRVSVPELHDEDWILAKIVLFLFGSLESTVSTTEESSTT